MFIGQSNGWAYERIQDKMLRYGWHDPDWSSSASAKVVGEQRYTRMEALTQEKLLRDFYEKLGFDVVGC